MRKWQKAHPEKMKEYHRSYYVKNRTKIALKAKSSKAKMYQSKWRIKFTDLHKARLFDILGRNCLRCGFDDIRALQFDHINGDGNKERKASKYKNHIAYWYKGWADRPEKAKQMLQVLCANCNIIKESENRAS